MAVQVTAGDTVRFHFLAFQLDGVTPYTGLSGGDFTVSLFQELSTSALSYILSEIGTTGVYCLTFIPDSVGYWHSNIKVVSTNDWFGDEVRVVGVDSVLSAEAQMNTAFEDSTTTLYMEVWLDRNGQSVSTDLVSCSVTLYDVAGASLFTEVSSSPKGDGRFSLSKVISLYGDRPYNASVTVVDVVGSVTTFQAFTTVD